VTRLAPALRELARRDPRLARIMKDRQPFRPPARPDPYRDLLQSIISQQLSVQAADTIFARFLDLFPRRQSTPARLAALSDAVLRGAGVSRQKAGYLRNVAVAALHGRPAPCPHLRTVFGRRSDRAPLTAIKGVGRWTAEMLLMFTLDRPDVFPVGDVGIQAAMIKLYGLRVRGPALRRRVWSSSPGAGARIARRRVIFCGSGGTHDGGPRGGAFSGGLGLVAPGAAHRPALRLRQGGSAWRARWRCPTWGVRRTPICIISSPLRPAWRT
jgi:DNA-3-methyladenine glycosylase II